MYFGLNLTFASSFQMLRGSVMFFTAVLSVIFLKVGFSLAVPAHAYSENGCLRNHAKQVIKLFRWAGIGIVITGLGE